MEQRRHPRFKVEAPIWVWSIASDSARAIPGHCFNLSEGGTGAMISGPWQPGQVVRMQLDVSGSQPITVEARLSHRSRHYCGFEFLGASELVIGQVRSACAAAA
ncbi:MAG: PilZ domain-containing protein [Acidobacteriia bacterium]|nr:PilZ domain-containing protein [Terriglobia bacterium]